ncbi:MAG: 6-phosphogluconate dehydrogenase [Bacteroidia bacterium]|nr:6-phosphogluconate dehydrogenase [Sphingobacteriaceae bacterium]MBP9070519.1 6-phosphogluconate dehydrogenase [Bacteroidia bacterium]
MEAVTQTAPAPKRPFRKILIISLLIITFCFWIFYLICGLAYSEGTHSGILTKVSKKGYIFKTYEGEMNVGGFSQGDGTIMPATIFKFSVKDEAIYHKLDSLQGKKLVLGYKEVYKVFFWQGETEYFIHDIRLMN